MSIESEIIARDVANLSVEERFGNLAPEEKLAALKAMGFVAFWEQHQPDCGAQYDRGLRCNCIPPGTSWRAPRDVVVFMGETYEQLRDHARQRR